MIARLPFAVWLIVVWVSLWGDVSAANIVGGAGVAAAALLLFPSAGPRRGFTFRPLHAARFAGYFFYKLIEANAVVAWEVLTPNNAGVREAVVAVPLGDHHSDAVVTLIANAISLTPGTLTLEVRRDPTVLLIHVLHLRSVEDTRAQVRRLEHLAVRAFGHQSDRPPAMERQA